MPQERQRLRLRKETDASCLTALAAPPQLFENGIGVIDAATPGAAPSLLESGPEPGVIRQLRGGREVFPRGTAGENPGAFFWRARLSIFADEINAAFQPLPINDNSNPIALAQFANRAAGQRF